MAIYSQSQRQYLFDAINELNPGAISPAQFANATFGKPRAIKPLTADGPNTEITLRGRQGRGYVGSQTYRYKRLSLNDIFKSVNVTITSPLAYGNFYYIERRRAFAQNINSRYGLNLETEDIPQQYVYLNTKNGMTIASSCIQYTGSFVFNSIRGKNALEDAVLDDVLPILTHPIDLDPEKLCATMLSFGHDLSDEPQVAQGLVNGRLDVGANDTSGATVNLLNVLEARGLPRFNTRGATIMRTTPKVETRANPMFDNVLVITNVNDDKVGGDWLLHYNN